MSGIKKRKVKVAPRVLYMKNGKIALEFTEEEYKALKDSLFHVYYETDDINKETIVQLSGKSSYDFYKNKSADELDDVEKRMFDYSKQRLRNSVILKRLDDTTPYVYSSNGRIGIYTNTDLGNASARKRDIDYEKYASFPYHTLPKDYENFEQSYLKKYPKASYNEVYEAYMERAKKKK